MGRSSIHQVFARFLAEGPKYNTKYEKHCRNSSNSAVNRILHFISEIGDVDINKVAHNIVEHEEAGSFLNGFFGVVSIDEIEYWGKNLVHALDVDCFRIEFGKNEEDSGHMVVVV